MSGRNLFRIGIWLFIALLCFRIHGNNVKLRRIAEENKKYQIELDFKKCVRDQVEWAELLADEHLKNYMIITAVPDCAQKTGYKVTE